MRMFWLYVSIIVMIYIFLYQLRTPSYFDYKVKGHRSKLLMTLVQFPSNMHDVIVKRLQVSTTSGFPVYTSYEFSQILGRVINPFESLIVFRCVGGLIGVKVNIIVASHQYFHNYTVTTRVAFALEK